MPPLAFPNFNPGQGYKPALLSERVRPQPPPRSEAPSPNTRTLFSGSAAVLGRPRRSEPTSLNTRTFFYWSVSAVEQTFAKTSIHFTELLFDRGGRGRPRSDRRASECKWVSLLIDRNCGDCEEMYAILETDLTLINKAKVSFMDQRRSLQHMARLLPPHVLMRQPVQFVINQRRQLLQRTTVPVTPLPQQQSHIVRSGCH